uniref:alpha-tocopherol transfer protein-like n=1 Tax=Styela clava TaxID=7725 RepID=UPI00193A6560|nr:alpha-tocopherol transfer protein-like [Styela clava]
MSGPRYKCTLSEELLDKAVRELNEPRDNEKRLEAIDKLRDAFKEKYKNYTLIREDDEFILRFLRAKKFDHDKALKVLGNYHYSRKDLPEVFERVENPALLKDTVAIGYVYVLPHKDKDGVSVMIYRDGLLTDDVDVYSLLALFMLGLERMLEDEAFQIDGLSIIEDMKDLSFKVIVKFTMSVMRKMMFMIQDAMPIRYKLMHLVNEGTFYDAMFKMIKPFLKKKMKERIVLHGTNFTKLHEQIDPEYLPGYLGGTGGDPIEAAIKWGEELCEWKENPSTAL